jgi:hypothetical protein
VGAIYSFCIESAENKESFDAALEPPKRDTPEEQRRMRETIAALGLGEVMDGT